MPYIAVKCCVGISHRTDGMSGIPIFTPIIVRLHTALKCMQKKAAWCNGKHTARTFGGTGSSPVASIGLFIEFNPFC